MLYAVDTGRELTADGGDSIDMPKVDAYRFKQCEVVSEEEMFRRFKKEYFIIKHKAEEDSRRKQQHPFDTRYTGASGFPPTSEVQRKTYPPYPLHGYFIVPKLYGYFPFLDCDSKRQYDNCCVELNMNDVNYVAYQSREPDHYWIFCDKQGDFEETLKFIEGYPCDPRYAWVASYKKEFTIRALPKARFYPKRISEINNDMSDDFKYWLSCFEKHWTDGLIEKYKIIHDTMEAL